MRRAPALPSLVCLLAVCAAPPPPAWGWTSAMDERVTREAARLMPASLRAILETHAESLRAGAREAAGEEPADVHSMDPGQKGASAAARLEELIPQAVSAIDDHRPFAEVARLLGRIAHYAGDLNNPLQAASEDPREDRYATQYTVYVERNLAKYPLVFYGWADASLDTASSPRQGVRAFAEQAARRSRGDYAPIRTAYDPGNPVPRERRFDERSLPFGIGSLSWSRTVTDTARLWRHVWRLAHGDMAGTPYLEAQKTAAGPPSQKPPLPAARASAPASSAKPGAAQPKSAAEPKPPEVKVIRPRIKPKAPPPEADPNAPSAAPSSNPDPNAGAGESKPPAAERSAA
jgi:hypothetical protein